MKIVRIAFALIGLTWLLGVMAFGAGTSWLMHDPDAAAGVALGAMAVDGNAGVIENAESFAGGYAAGSELSATVRELEAKESVRSTCRSQEDSDWAAPEACDKLAESDREIFERLAAEW